MDVFCYNRKKKDIWCYLVNGSFNWKIGIFQKTVVSGLLYPYERVHILMK